MGKILVVDDSNLSRRMLKAILQPAGYEIVEASEGMEAIEKYFIEKPTVVFLDMTMAGMHGLEVLKQLRSMDPQSRVIIATADIQSSTREMTSAGGACAFVEKPFVQEKVLSALRSVLESTPC